MIINAKNMTEYHFVLPPNLLSTLLPKAAASSPFDIFSVTPNSPGPVVKGKNPASLAPLTAWDTVCHIHLERRSGISTKPTHLCKLLLAQRSCPSIPASSDFAERVYEQAQQLHVNDAGNRAGVSAVNKCVFFGAKYLGSCRSLGAEVNRAVTPCRRHNWAPEQRAACNDANALTHLARKMIAKG
jgi:hypothetical protein